MAIDPSIAMGYRGLGELPNPMNQLAQVSQIQQSMRQGQMAEMQYKKALDTEAKLSKYYASIAENGGPKTALEAEQAMFGSGVKEIQNMGAQTQMLRLQNERELERFRGAQSPAGGAPAAAAPMEAPVNMMPGAVAAPARVNNLGGRTVDDMRAERDRMGLLPGKLAADRVKTLTADIALASREPSYQNVPGVGLVNPRDMSVVMPSVESTDPVIKQYNLAVSQGFKGSILDYKREIARAGRAPAQPRPEQPPVAVVDPATGRTVYVSREEALGQRMTPASAMESLPPKEIQKRESVYPAATSAVKGFESKSEAFIKDLKALRNHPGLSSITGIAAGRLPGVTAEGRAAQALYDKVVAKGGFQALQDLRDASKTGGALGNVSNREGQQLTASFAAIDRRQDAPDVQAAIDGAIAGVEGARIRTREAYDNTYSYKNPAGQATPLPAAATIPQAAIDALNAGVGTPAQFDAQFGAGAAARVKGKK